MSPQYNRSKRSQVKADEAVELARALECKSYACCEALFPIFLVRGEAKCLQVVVHVGEIFLCVAVAQEIWRLAERFAEINTQGNSGMHAVLDAATVHDARRKYSASIQRSLSSKVIGREQQSHVLQA